MSKLADDLERLAREDNDQIWELPPHPDEGCTTEYGKLLDCIAPHLPALLRALEALEEEQTRLCFATDFVPSANDDQLHDAYRALLESANGL